MWRIANEYHKTPSCNLLNVLCGDAILTQQTDKIFYPKNGVGQ